MIVLKFGGHAMSENNLEWMAEIAQRWKLGEKFVIVHGGGPMIDQQLEIEGVTSEFVDGFRITTPEVMRVVEAVLTGSVLRSIVRGFKKVEVPVVGISGSDGDLLEVEIREDGRFGLVGQVISVNTAILETLIAGGFLPVVSPVSVDKYGRSLNINADLAAGSIAGALSAEQVIFMTDVAGIYRKWPDKDSLIEGTTVAELNSINFEKGMIPKVEAVKMSIESGAKSARIIDGRDLKAFRDGLSGKGGTWVSE